MSVYGLTFKEIRQQVAANVMGSAFVNSAPSRSGDTLTLIDDTLWDVPRGWHFLGTGGAIDGDESRVEFFEKSGHKLNLYPALSAATDTSQTYELYDPRYSPRSIKDAVNQCIREASGRWYAKEEYQDLHGNGKIARFDLPSRFHMVYRLDYRTSVERTLVHECDVAWDESVDSDFTVSLDTEQYPVGGNSVRIDVGGSVSDGDKVTDSISSLNISAHTTIEMWIRVAQDVAAGDLLLLLDDTASCASPIESLSIPALSADVWNYVRLELAEKEDDTAIISVGLEYNTNAQANTIWLKRITANTEYSSIWKPLHKSSWYAEADRLDSSVIDLFLTDDGRKRVGYSLMKVHGGSRPTALDSDDDVCDLPESYVIAHATAYTLQAGSQGRENDQDDRRGLAAYWLGKAAEEARKFRLPPNTRKVV